MNNKTGDFFQGKYYKTIFLGKNLNLCFFPSGKIDISRYDEKASKKLWIKLGWIDLNELS